MTIPLKTKMNTEDYPVLVAFECTAEENIKKGDIYVFILDEKRGTAVVVKRKLSSNP